MGLSVSGLTKRFGDRLAVDAISFEMNEPGVFGLIGTNGAGKTTTIRMILGILPADGGAALWDGKKITRETLSFGYMPEERGLYMKNKVIDQLVYFGMLRGMKRAEARASALSLMERMEVTEYMNMTAEKLSKGNQQKIQLIATLVHSPQLIFLDEPFSGLDPVNAETLRRVIDELVAEGRYIVMSSHQMTTVEQYCRDLVILDRGATVLSGNLKNIKAGYGHTKLVLSCAENVAPLAEKHGLRFEKHGENGDEYAITGDSMASGFLKELVGAGICPLKYEVSEPSLNDIFIEKVGEYR